MNTKMVIVCRKDLKCRTGKYCSHSGHNCLAFLYEEVKAAIAENRPPKLTPEQQSWFDTGQKKITVRVDSEKEFFEIYQRARQAGLTIHSVADAGSTEVPPGTKIAMAIGPNKEEDIDKITESLQLL